MPDSEDLNAMSEQWSQAVATNNWEHGLDVSCKGYRIAARNNDHVNTIMFLGFVRIAAERLFEKSSRTKQRKEPDTFECSFCAKSDKDIKLILGAKDIAICADCARLANESLNTQQGSRNK